MWQMHILNDYPKECCTLSVLDLLPMSLKMTILNQSVQEKTV